MTTVHELNWLAHLIAEDAAKADLRAFSKPAGGNWLEVVGNNQQLDRAQRYLIARGLLERTPGKPHLVRILKRPRHWALELASRAPTIGDFEKKPPKTERANANVRLR